ncbi:hypothetical protein [Rhodopseudomonas sp. B29]|uniref:hypothetical protein n=1 Tax=Rhodopseudomonas sp. B29 TaxID=95607 RepID=UPI0011D229F6|nr:hypothetical protein [Rhodopseudomonas sp. B29]
MKAAVSAALVSTAPTTELEGFCACACLRMTSRGNSAISGGGECPAAIGGEGRNFTSDVSVHEPISNKQGAHEPRRGALAIKPAAQAAPSNPAIRSSIEHDECAGACREVNRRKKIR